LIGLTWRAGHFNKPDGALFKETPLEAIALLLRDLDVEILCLQRQPAQDELDTLERILERPVADFSSLNQDLESMLALLDELDDYVAVSNTNVHLRAGLGKTARVLVPFPADYRWMASGDESPWFRGFRIYRQAVGGSWDNALATLQTDLWQAFSGHAPPPSAIPESWPEPTQRTAPQEPALRSYKIGKSNDLLPKVGKVNFVTIDSFAERDGRLTAELASTRYRVLLPGEQLARRGFGVRIFPRPEGGWRPDDAARFPEGAVVFSKSFSADNVSLAKELKERGHPVIVDICDNHFDHPSFGTDLRALCETATRIVVNTEAMAKAVEKATGGASLIVGDPLEGPRGIPAFAPRIPAIKILWFGHPTNLDSLAKALPQLAEAAGRHPIDLTILTRPDPAVGKLVTTISANPPAALSARSLAWSEAETWRQLELCDLVIIPSLEDDRRLVKSPNRLLETIWAGRLAVAHPLPSYQAFSDYCCLTEDIADGIAWAIDNQAVALDRVRAGQDAIALECSAWRIAADWEAAVYGNSSDRPLKLNLGCGDKILPDYLNVDIAPTRRGNRPDVMCDLRHLSMFPSDIADEILSVHVVEHFSRWEVEQVLAEWLRVLKPGGRMVIECPNLASACRAFLDDPRAAGGPGREGQRTMWVFYGDPAWKDPLMNHRWGYSPESLAELLEGAGLGNVRVEPAQFKLREPRDMRLVGEKPGGSADRGNATAGHGDNEPPPAMSAGAAADRASQTSRPLQPVAPRQAWDDYFVWFHETGVWKRLNYHGIRTLKFPPDMWNYQELIFEEDIDWVIETGTRHGGSALFFADTLAARQAPGRVISVDIDAGARQVRDDPRITFLVGDSGSARLAAEVEALLPADRGPLFLILDSDHAKQHVLRELAAWVPLLRSGDYLVVEDTCVNGHPARPDHGPGPMEAIREWLGSDRSGKLQADEARSRKFGATAAPNGYFKIK
jgi:cephalosporin hydroxylase/SAM-dependent methyltransferase